MVRGQGLNFPELPQSFLGDGRSAWYLVHMRASAGKDLALGFVSMGARYRKGPSGTRTPQRKFLIPACDPISSGFVGVRRKITLGWTRSIRKQGQDPERAHSRKLNFGDPDWDTLSLFTV
jgi:hypothetical protein